MKTRPIPQVFALKEIPGSDEEHGHVEGVDEVGNQPRGFGVADDHKDDGDGFDDGESGVASAHICNWLYGSVGGLMWTTEVGVHSVGS